MISSAGQAHFCLASPLACRRNLVSAAESAAARSGCRILWVLFRCPHLIARLRNGSRQSFWHERPRGWRQACCHPPLHVGFQHRVGWPAVKTRLKSAGEWLKNAASRRQCGRNAHSTTAFSVAVHNALEHKAHACGLQGVSSGPKVKPCSGEGVAGRGGRKLGRASAGRSSRIHL